MAILGNDERISAQTALRISLVSEVVARDALWDRAHTLAAKVAAKPTSAVQGTLRAIWESLDVGRQAALDMGLKIATGTDTALFDRGDNAREIGLLVESGFTPMQAIVAATRTSAEAIGLEQHIGTLEPGKVGELLLLAKDPLADINSLRDKDNIRWILKSRDQLI